MMNVLVLLSVTKDDGKHKPAISKCYNYTKRRADIIDQKMGNYTVKPKSSRLTIAAFSCILDAAHVNAATLSRPNQKKSAKTRSTNAFMYGWKLAISWIQPQLHHCHIFSNGLYKCNRWTFWSQDWKTCYTSWGEKASRNLLKTNRSCRSKKVKGLSRRNCFQMCKMQGSTLCKPFSKDLPDMFQVNSNVVYDLYPKKNRLKKLTMKIGVIYGLSCVLNIVDVIKNI